MAKKKARRIKTAKRKPSRSLDSEVQDMLKTFLGTWRRYYGDVTELDSEVVAACSLNYGSRKAKVLDELLSLYGRNSDIIFVPVHVGTVYRIQTFILPSLPRRGKYRQLESGLIVPYYIADMANEKGRRYNREKVRYNAVYVKRTPLLYRRSI